MRTSAAVSTNTSHRDHLGSRLYVKVRRMSVFCAIARKLALQAQFRDFTLMRAIYVLIGLTSIHTKS